MAFNKFEDSYKIFLKNLSKALAKEEGNPEATTTKLMEKLIALESKFRVQLYSGAGGRATYKKFIQLIVDEEKNILKARAYFRERQVVFTEQMAPLFASRDHWGLRKFRVNYKFIKWAVENYTGKNKRKLKSIFNQISETRDLLCKNNIPLAIHSANIFWSKIKYSQSNHIDIVQSASEGLLYAIDKYVPSGSKNGFRHVAIGRMTLEVMTEHNQTAVSMSPTDRRVLYRAKLGKKQGFQDKELVSFVKESFPNAQENSITDLISAETMTISADQKASQQGEKTVRDFLSEKESTEELLEKREMYRLLYKFIDQLDIIERKVVRMRFGL